ncbi:perforin-1-like isoform X1 [Brachyhypopomus gauderio]|uniref:perforin-1-like isoform X1 n=2 Tax=Brachyhypopomus gauderio TaxID=698409 RepID=UPI0040434CFE
MYLKYFKLQLSQMMGQIWNCLLGWWLCYSLLSMVTGEEQLVLGSPEDCKNADFVPGYNLGGEGFDIVKMEQKGSYVIDMEKWDTGNGSCMLCTNRYLNQQKEKLPAAVTSWRTISKCSQKISSKIYESSEALVKDSTSSVSNNWKVGLEVPLTAGVSIGGTHSRESTNAMAKSKEDKFSFTKHEVKCSFYSYHVASSPPLHQEFLQALKSLLPTSNSHSYQSLIDKFGTHYTTGVDLGGKISAVTAIRTCKAAMSGLTDTAVKDCLDVEASGTYQGATLKTELSHCQELKKKMGIEESFSSMFDDRQTEVIGGNINDDDLLFSSTSQGNARNMWMESLKTIPGVVSYTLTPLHLLLDDDNPAKGGLKKAIENYISRNALNQVCSESCKVGKKNSARDRCVCVCEKSTNIMSNCCPVERGLATLKVFKLYAKGLYGDTFTQTDGSVEVKYGNLVHRTAVIDNNDNPRWTESFEFGPIKISQTNKLTFKVYDDDTYWNSELLGTCDFDLNSGNVSDECMFQYGSFFFSYSVECAPSLNGPKCADYSPSPMSSSLAEIFHSRNGILAKDMWKLKTARNNIKTLYFKGHYGGQESRFVQQFG